MQWVFGLIWVFFLLNQRDPDHPLQGAAQINGKDTHVHSGIDEAHASDAKGRPAGGRTKGNGIAIRWQKGPLVNPKTGERKEPNGAFVEDVIDAAIGRIEFYQRSEFHCLENAVALGHLKAAAEALDERTRGRQDRGVEGSHAL